ncbi:MAG: porin [Desulfuromonas sp.]|uniref:porin n=1 Tax=Desulfuromonas sp. TaxID=892 RepID=UPI000CB43A09|nr:porin [Desulfuromonas sp.]PLX83212.1 MAG: porin [Desulfuromonas sp.]
MRRKLFFWSLALLALPLLAAAPAQAGAKIEIGDDAVIDLGFRLQAQYFSTEKDLDGGGDFEDFDDFIVRRARLRLGADVTDRVSIFLQSEFADDDGGVGGDVRLIDAYVTLKAHKLTNIIVGENMAASLRQNLTSSGALMAVDRPAIVNKNLSWGTRAKYGFTNTNYDDSDAGLRADNLARDVGATLFGSDSITDTLHFKYYLGVYDGVQEGDEDSERYAARVQFNLFDAEPKYYNLSTYLGGKRTLGFGATYDLQNDVAVDLATGKNADYAMWTVDAFADLPLGPGALTLETAWIDLDLDDAARLNFNGDGASFRDARQAQGDGYYIQAGYFISNWQPWVLYEQWSSDGPGDLGSFNALRVGLSYFLKGHNANIKVGYEGFSADRNLSGTSEDSVDSLVAGLYVTY